MLELVPHAGPQVLPERFCFFFSGAVELLFAPVDPQRAALPANPAPPVRENPDPLKVVGVRVSEINVPLSLLVDSA